MEGGLMRVRYAGGKVGLTLVISLSIAFIPRKGTLCPRAPKNIRIKYSQLSRFQPVINPSNVYIWSSPRLAPALRDREC